MRNLQENAEKFRKKLCNIVIVCKGSREAGKKWKQLAGVDFPILADEHAQFVKAFKFSTSLWNTCRTFMRCSKAELLRESGRFELMADEKRDIFQLGGEVLMDAKGKIKYLHKCQTSDDRPPCSELLQLIPKEFVEEQSTKKPSECCVLL